MCKCPLTGLGDSLGDFVEDFTLRTGYVTRVGRSRDTATVTMFGTFQFDGDLDLSETTITVESILDEMGDAGELVQPHDLFPWTLKPFRYSRTDRAFYISPHGSRPRLRMEIRKIGREDGLYGFKLILLRAMVPNFPENCTVRNERHVTALSTRFILENEGAIQIAGAASFWQCKGRDPQMPRLLKVGSQK